MNLSGLQITRYNEVNEIIRFEADLIIKSLGDSLVGLYLFGSLTYGDFNEHRSDIDLVAILKKSAKPTESEGLRQILALIRERYPNWTNRVEVSYTPMEMFESSDPPGKRPYFGGGRFWPDALYGHEWIINNYLLYKYGTTILGPDIRTLFKEPTVEQVKEASIKVFYEELEPILRNKEWLDEDHYQSYIVLNLCRILRTVANSDARSKKVATSWVISKFPEWSKLIQAAEDWKYGDEFAHSKEVIEFIRFVGQQIQKISGVQ